MKARLWKGTGPAHVLVCVPTCALVAAIVLAGCAGDSSSTSSSTISAVPSSPAASTAAATSVDAVAFVASTPISKASYEHWLAVEKAGGSSADAGHRALGFLITSQWMVGEAAARKLSASETEVKQRFAEISKHSFPKAGSLQKFLSKAEETEADLLARVKVELLESRIASQLTAGKSAAQRTSILQSFQQAFQRRWKARTTCKPGYIMEDCSEYHGKRENLAAPSSAASAPRSSSSASPSTRSGSSKSSASSTSSRTGEVYSAPGSFAISSPAFELNGAIPTQYTCDGADISPPLDWQHVPAKTAALVLFIIDDNESYTGSGSGIRWVIGDIDPRSSGVAAGKIPEGGIVGSDTQGHAGYGGICPEHGKTDTIEFTLYALSKKIPLTPGFQPAVAEREYGAGKLLLGSTTTYGVYTRP